MITAQNLAIVVQCHGNVEYFLSETVAHNCFNVCLDRFVHCLFVPGIGGYPLFMPRVKGRSIVCACFCQHNGKGLIVQIGIHIGIVGHPPLGRPCNSTARAQGRNGAKLSEQGIGIAFIQRRIERRFE